MEIGGGEAHSPKPNVDSAVRCKSIFVNLVESYVPPWAVIVYNLSLTSGLVVAQKVQAFELAHRNHGIKNF